MADDAPDDSAAPPPVDASLAGAPSAYGSGWDPSTMPSHWILPPDSEAAPVDASSGSSSSGTASGGPDAGPGSPAAGPTSVADVTGGPTSLPAQPVAPAQDQAAGGGPPSAVATPADITRQRQADQADIDKRVAYYRSNPVALAGDEAGQAETARQRFLTDSIKAEEASRAQATQNIADYTTAGNRANEHSEKLWADSQRIGATKLDGTLGGLGTGKAILGALMGGLGGAMAPSMGGRNIGLEAVNKAIDRNIEVQKADLENQHWSVEAGRNIIADEWARHGDLYRATEAYRVGALQSVKNQLALEAQNYDPRGTMARQIAGAQNNVTAQIAQHVAAYQQQRFTNELAAVKAQGELEKPVIEARQKQAEIDAANQRSQAEIALGYSRIASEDKRSAAEMKMRGDELEEKRNERKDTKDLARQKDWDERGLGNTATGEPMVTAQGAPMLAKARELEAAGDQKGAADLRQQAALTYGIKMGNAEDAQKVQGMTGYAQALTDNLAKIRAQLDADPGITNRAAWAQLASTFTHGKVDEIKGLGMNASSREMDAFEDEWGDSPEKIMTRLKATGGQAKLRAHLDAIESAVGTDVNDLMKAKKVLGGWKPTPLTTYKPPPTGADILQKQALATQPDERTTRQSIEDKVLWTIDSAPGIGRILPGVPSVADLTARSVGLDPSEDYADLRAAAIEQLGREGLQADPREGEKYITSLDEVARNGITGKDRKLAEDALSKLRERLAGPTTATTPGPSSDSMAGGVSAMPEPEPNSSQAPEPEPNSSPGGW